MKFEWLFKSLIQIGVLNQSKNNLVIHMIWNMFKNSWKLSTISPKYGTGQV